MVHDLDRRHRAGRLEDHVKLMFDLQVLALQTDMTRVSTFQLARETSTRDLPADRCSRPAPSRVAPHDDPGSSRSWRRSRPSRVGVRVPRGTATGDARRQRLLARPLDVHARQRDGQPRRARSLDDADRRRGGGAGGARPAQGGRHIKYAQQTPLANLHLTLLDKVGVHLDGFADSTGTVAELLQPLAV